MNYPELIYPLIFGFIMDNLLGDPHWLPHPIRLFGRFISGGEKRWNAGKRRKLKGAVFSVGLVFGVSFLFWFILNVLSNYKYIFLIVTSILVFYGLANHSLIKESLIVLKKLRKEGIVEARKQLSMIVGRDTQNLTDNEIRTAILETLAENLSDGVIAPLFYYFIGGIPAMFAYKMVNTLDSMIGYKSERFKNFGWFAAKLDDILNFIPARLTAFIMVMVTFSFRGFKFVYKYGRKHSSPNAGFPEAALAGILNCRFGGSNIYNGVLVEKPFIGNNPRVIFNKDIYKACAINFFSTFIFISLFVIFIGIIT
ncbi:MAG: adenosylcobinamide-phosphate synthase CbiB [Draconibacterium sp.]|nr:adenosylcobinamide-phosphate synthase CbiB [Draconibacterium sp.]